MGWDMGPHKVELGSAGCGNGGMGVSWEGDGPSQTWVEVVRAAGTEDWE